MSTVTTITTITTPQMTGTSQTAREAGHTAATPPAPSIHRRLLLTWLAVYPTITVVQLFLGTSVAHFALPVRTLIVTALVAPVVVYVALPQILKIDRRLARAWVNRGR
jgi:antibiotic biosynthesis monooxygenase (ABM) superfamily enzyme